jgi:hypothetical protein
MEYEDTKKEESKKTLPNPPTPPFRLDTRILKKNKPFWKKN